MKRKKYKMEHQVKEVKIVVQHCIQLTNAKNENFSK